MRIPRLDVNKGTFSTDIWNRFCLRYGEKRAKKLIFSLSKPVKNFSLRITLTTTSREIIIDDLEQIGWKTKIHNTLKDMITVETIGPMDVPYLQHAPRIVIDKIAAESILTGSDLFGLGIINVPKFNAGEIVSLVSQKDQIVAIGKSKTNSKYPKKPGIAVLNMRSFYKVPSLRNLSFFDSGKAYSQSIPAAYTVHILDPKPGEKIIDLCAAPGGKSTGAAILSNNKAKIISFDRSKKRLKKMEEIIKNEKLKNIKTVNVYSLEYLKNHKIKADKVIVDPTCSAIGVRPKIYEETTTKEILSAANYQKSFLKMAAEIVRKKGTITYSKCTLEPEENEKNIAYAVNELGLKLVEPDFNLGTIGEETNDGLILEYMRRFYPDESDTVGFFVAKLSK